MWNTEQNLEGFAKKIEWYFPQQKELNFKMEQKCSIYYTMNANKLTY